MQLRLHNAIVSLTPRFSGVWGGVRSWPTRFNVLAGARETTEAVRASLLSLTTPLKQGVNERRRTRWSKAETHKLRNRIPFFEFLSFGFPRGSFVSGV